MSLSGRETGIVNISICICISVSYACVVGRGYIWMAPRSRATRAWTGSCCPGTRWQLGNFLNLSPLLLPAPLFCRQLPKLSTYSLSALHCSNALSLVLSLPCLSPLKSQGPNLNRCCNLSLVSQFLPPVKPPTFYHVHLFLYFSSSSQVQGYTDLSPS
jgi:hypothetical protein